MQALCTFLHQHLKEAGFRGHSLFAAWGLSHSCSRPEVGNPATRAPIVVSDWSNPSQSATKTRKMRVQWIQLINKCLTVRLPVGPSSLRSVSLRTPRGQPNVLQPILAEQARPRTRFLVLTSTAAATATAKRRGEHNSVAETALPFASIALLLRRAGIVCDRHRPHHEAREHTFHYSPWPSPLLLCPASHPSTITLSQRLAHLIALNHISTDEIAERARASRPPERASASESPASLHPMQLHKEV